MDKRLFALGLSLAAFAVFLLWSVASVAQECVPTSSGPGLWSEVVNNSGDVYIGHAVQIDPGLEVVIDGSLVVCDGGSLEGSSGSITFTIPAGYTFAGGDFNPADRGLWVFGSIDLSGAPVTPWMDAVAKGGFTELEYGVTQSAAISSGSATLAVEPEGWQVGGQLLLMSERGDTQLATLESISGRQITYSGAGGFVGSVLNFRGEQIRPKVGYLSRSFVIRATGGRSHTAIMPGGSGTISHVELQDMGVRGALGRYPIHAHLMGAGGHQVEVIGNAIWQTTDDGGNRAIVIHESQGVTVADNIAYRIRGHAVFMESGPEFDNVVTGNLVADVRWPEELPNVDSGIFGGTSHAPNHYWLRQGNTIAGNVAVGGDIDSWPFNRFTDLNGMAVIHGEKQVDTLVDGFECLGCGGFGLWTYVPDNQVQVTGARMAYARNANWYPVLGGTTLSDALLLLGGRNTLWGGQAFANSKGALDDVIENTLMAGYTGVNLHYIGHIGIVGGVIQGQQVLKTNYWENTARLTGVEMIGPSLFANIWPSSKRSAPAPIWIEGGSTWNSQEIDGVYARQGQHSRFFDTVGDPIQFGIEIQPEPAYFMPRPVIQGQGYHGTNYYRTVTLPGQPEGPYTSPNEYETGYQASIAAGNLGYPYGFPAGDYVVRYYTYPGKEFLREETYQLGDGTEPPPPAPPTVRILTAAAVYPDTDQAPGESVEIVVSISDPDTSTDRLAVEILVDGGLVSTDTSSMVQIADGGHEIMARVTDDAGLSASDVLDVVVESPPAVPPEDIFRDQVIQLLEKHLQDRQQADQQVINEIRAL